MSQRPCAKTQGQSLMVAWQDIPWKKIHRHVFRLQKRIYRATQQGRVRIARKLQKLLVKSWYARLLAVRRISQDNRGRPDCRDGRGDFAPTRLDDRHGAGGGQSLRKRGRRIVSNDDERTLKRHDG